MSLELSLMNIHISIFIKFIMNEIEEIKKIFYIYEQNIFSIFPETSRR